jgi:tetratricopeptide (TPR) repeat protein
MNNRVQDVCLIVVIALLSFKIAPVFAGQVASPELITANKLFLDGNYSGALDAYRGAIRNQKPADQPPTQYWIGFCCLMQGKDAEAVKEFLKIPESYPSEGMWVSTAYYWAGRASERMGKKEQAVEFYRKAGGNGKSTQERFAMKKADAVNGKASNKSSNNKAQNSN